MNLILTTAARYRPEQLTRFVESWKRCCPETDLAVIASALPPETCRYLSEAGADVIPAELNLAQPIGWRKAWFQVQLGGWLRWLKRSRRLLGIGSEADRLHARIAEAAFHLFCQRAFHYRRYLDHFGWRYSQVLIADIRDTLFQRSPFPCEGLHVFAENELLGHSHFARRWFQLTYGESTFRRLGSKPHLCAGVTLGDLRSVQAYLNAMCGEMLRLGAVADVDQAFHNYVIHEQRVPAVVHPFGDGCAINLNATPVSELRVKDGELLDQQGLPYAIVHQYDRVPLLDLRPRIQPSPVEAAAPTAPT